MEAKPENTDGAGAPGPNEEIAPKNEQSARSGLKPIERFNSDDRVSRIVPDTASGALAQYCSKFARDFLDANFYFCSAKFSVARHGKLKAIDAAFRETEDWFQRAGDWIAQRNQVEFALAYEEVPVSLTHPLAGRLLRLVRQYDRFFANTLFSQAARSISGSERDTNLQIARKRISMIHQLCMPDTDRFHPDGTRKAEGQ